MEAKITAKRLRKHGDISFRLCYLIDTLGASAVAWLIGVPKKALMEASRASRELSPDAKRHILDVDYVLSRALLLHPPTVVLDWLQGTEPTLGFARPMDVIRTGRAFDLVGVLDRLEAGAYA